MRDTAVVVDLPQGPKSGKSQGAGADAGDAPRPPSKLRTRARALHPGAGARNGGESEGGRPPGRRSDEELGRPRGLSAPQAEKLLKAAKSRGRHPHRDHTLLLVIYTHGLRVGEAVALRWDHVDLEQGLVHVERLKSGISAVHPLRGPEIRALRRLKREQNPPSPFVFTGERGSPLTV